MFKTALRLHWAYWIQPGERMNTDFGIILPIFRPGSTEFTKKEELILKTIVIPLSLEILSHISLGARSKQQKREAEREESRNMDQCTDQQLPVRGADCAAAGCITSQLHT